MEPSLSERDYEAKKKGIGVGVVLKFGRASEDKINESGTGGGGMGI